eukprot:TRINITY_DN13884_c0_g1_i1.p1 TRINITY_DN13884_c0_g1~~TRINITY_DN13884_c0_g1_i1.p1  ORF type:complete len:1021 (-),score=208.38 TRINITY_DN13884_c0_g1_i1:122-3157(-)
MGAAVGKVIDIDKYRVKVKEIIAEGGFSYVFVVKDIQTGVNYAMKRMVVDEGERLDNAKAEIRIMQSLPRNPHIVQLLASSITKSQGLYEVRMLMEYCDGGSVFHIMKERGERRLSEPDIYKIFQQACEAVAVLHAHNPPIIHRDLKIENILLHPSGVYKLCDFGSCTTNQVDTVTARNRGAIEEDIQRNTTPQYRAPEMIDTHRGLPITTKADIWALGCMLYRMAYRQDAFESTLKALGGTWKAPASSTFTPELGRLLNMLLERDQQKRPDIFAVLEHLEALTGVKSNIRRGEPIATSNPLRDELVRRNSIGKMPLVDRKSSAAAGDLFSQLDWYDSGTQAPAAAPSVPSRKASPPRGSISPPARRPSHPRRESDGLHSAPSRIDAAEHGVGKGFKNLMGKFVDKVKDIRGSPFDKWVRHATVDDMLPPKQKYLRLLIIQSWETWEKPTTREQTAAALSTAVPLPLLHALQHQPVEENSVVCFKAMTTLLFLCQEGAPTVLGEAFHGLDWLEHLQQFYKTKRDSRLALLVNYIDLLRKKIEFHHDHRAFEGSMSLDTYLFRLHSLQREKSVVGDSEAINNDSVKELQGLQDLTITLHADIQKHREDPLILGAAVPLIRESYHILLVTIYAIARLVEVRGFKSVEHLARTLNGQVDTLFKFYETYRDMPEISRLTPIPHLPDRPDFQANVTVKPPPSSMNPATLQLKLQRKSLARLVEPISLSAENSPSIQDEAHDDSASTYSSNSGTDTDGEKQPTRRRPASARLSSAPAQLVDLHAQIAAAAPAVPVPAAAFDPFGFGSAPFAPSSQPTAPSAAVDPFAQQGFGTADPFASAFPSGQDPFASPFPDPFSTPANVFASPVDDADHHQLTDSDEEEQGDRGAFEYKAAERQYDTYVDPFARSRLIDNDADDDDEEESYHGSAPQPVQQSAGWASFEDVAFPAPQPQPAVTKKPQSPSVPSSATKPLKPTLPVPSRTNYASRSPQLQSVDSRDSVDSFGEGGGLLGGKGGKK